MNIILLKLGPQTRNHPCPTPAKQKKRFEFLEETGHIAVLYSHTMMSVGALLMRVEDEDFLCLPTQMFKRGSMEYTCIIIE